MGLNIKDRWETRGPGLDLIVENALDDSWTPYLKEYVTKWDNGEPDALSLTISRVKKDSTCNPSFGKLKVCNGDYGETTWEGLNLSLVQEGFIRWSTAKMNDYFLINASEAAKRYTMCHELGHGFGLTHSDEEYYNMNRGDCMDYTHQPEGNLLTGRSNHNTLKKVYGRSSSKNRSPKQNIEIPQHIIEKYYEIEEQVHYSNEGVSSKWVEDLGEGYHITINKLIRIEEFRRYR